jgi:hypothetical protein
MNRLLAAQDLKAELSLETMAPYLKPSCEFVLADMKNVDGKVLAARIAMRENAPPATLPKIEASRILVIESKDSFFVQGDDSKAQNVLVGCKFAELEKGGLHPHLVCPDAILALVMDHLSPFREHVETQDEEMDDEY